MSKSVQVHEIYVSLQGESSWAGWPCIFVRLTGCPLRCSYCDTAYAFRGGRRWEVVDVVREVGRLAEPWRVRAACSRLPLVEVTGGEPLAQPAAVRLLAALCSEGYTVLLETSGALDIGEVDERVIRVVDFKCPSSGEEGRNRWENVKSLRGKDEVKFVVGTVEDYEWMREVLERWQLTDRCSVLVSWAAPLTVGQRHPELRLVPRGHRPLSVRALAERLVSDGLPVRFQVQMHKVIWPADQRGV